LHEYIELYSAMAALKWTIFSLFTLAGVVIVILVWPLAD
jgi:hypothetical protein